MLNINYEFRKGIFFLRLFGNMNKKNYLEKRKEIEKLIIDNGFKYIVINTNYLNKIDLDGINCIMDIYLMSKSNDGYFWVCDKFNIINKLFNNNIKSIKEEIELF